MRRHLPAPTLIDRVVGYVSPTVGLARLSARLRMQALTPGYRGGRRDRRPTQEWQTSLGSADDALLDSLPELWSRSSDLVRNAPLARGALNTAVTHVVGAGLRCHPKVDREALGLSADEADRIERELQRIWQRWAASADCTTERVCGFAEVQKLAFRSALEFGDVFASLRYRARPGAESDFHLQMIEAPRVCNPDAQADSATLAGGVEMDSDGAAIAYHVGDRANLSWKYARPEKWTRLPVYSPATGRRQVLHIARRQRIGQTRGEPFLAPVIEAFKQLSDYTDAELQAAIIASFFTVFIKSTDGSGDLAPSVPGAVAGSGGQENDYRMEPAAIIGLDAGEDISTANPGRPNENFDPFVVAILRQIGVALEIPHEMLIKHFTASYSASRAAIEEAWAFFRTARDWMAREFCQPVYVAVIEEAVARGAVTLPGFWGAPAARAAWLGAEWVGPAKPSLDPLKEYKAAEIAEDRGWTTAANNAATLFGGDWEQNAERRLREREVLGGGAAAPAAASAADETDEDEDQPDEDGDDERN